MRELYDIAVVGGGASGLTAALSASIRTEQMKQPLRVVLLEGNARVGKKLLATGNGRCNLTNRGVSPAHYHGDRKLAASVLEQYPSKRIIEFFQELGLLCRELDEGRVYPYSLQAASVLDILRQQAEQYGVEMLCDCPVSRAVRQKNGFTLFSNERTIQARRVILATGGLAYPQLGANDSGHRMAKELGHSVTPLYPALVQMKTESKRAKPLKGMRSMAEAVLWCDGKELQKSAGEVQFTEHGLSGICIFELSRKVEPLLQKKRKIEVSLDLLPEYTEQSIFQILCKTAEKLPKLPGIDLMGGLLNKMVGREILRLAVPNLPQAAYGFRTGQLRAAARMAKMFCFPITGVMPWSSAQVTAGGIPLQELCMNTMESNRCKGLYLTGELLNVDGDCGGFNLHWAWSTGLIAGNSCAASLEKKR